MLLIFHSVPFPITKTVELFVALLENFKISSESKTPVIFILTATYTTRPTFIDILLIMDTLFGTVTPKRELLFYMELLKCHSIFVRFFIGSNKFVDLSIVIFKPPGYFPSSSCHLNCRRYSTLDELLFKTVKTSAKLSIDLQSCGAYMRSD